MPVRCLFAVAVCVMALLVGPVAAQAAARLGPCPGQSDFQCGTLRVPLDRGSDASPTVALRYAVQRRTSGGPRRVLIALSGGPGQPTVGIADVLALSLEPALTRYRLAVLDQRGTGGSGLLRCPNVQRLRSLDAFTPSAVAACARSIGPRRAYYTTADTVLDLEDLRQELGVDEVALAGVSYGTYVALQYARAFPARVDRLILDSIVGPDRPDGFLLDSYASVSRVLRETCARRGCAGITSDPVADVRALVQRLDAGPLRGAAFDARGRRRATSLRDAEELLMLLESGDLNPFLQAALPAAMAAARRGDNALLLRLRRPAQGSPTSARDLSFGVLVATNCEDAQMPYSLQTPISERPALTQAALAAIPPARYAPFDAQTVLRTSNVGDCERWPTDSVRQPFTGPLPNVPALLLSGRLDLRTPLENAQATARQLPQATVVSLRGGGHDVIDSDVTGCASIALDRFARGRAVGRPCVAQDNGVDPLPLPPRVLSDFRSASGVGGRRGRAVFAALDTVSDAYVAALIALYAGLGPRGGGLHGGRFVGTTSLDGTLLLDRYAYLPGLRLTGRVRTLDGRARGGTVTVRGLGLDGTLTFERRGGVSGVLGGRRVSYRPRSGRAASGLRVTRAAMSPVAPRAPRPR